MTDPVSKFTAIRAFEWLMQQRTDHAVIFVSRPWKARHPNRIPFHMKAADLTLRFPRSLPAPEIARIPPIGFAHAVEYDGVNLAGNVLI